MRIDILTAILILINTILISSCTPTDNLNDTNDGADEGNGTTASAVPVDTTDFSDAGEIAEIPADGPLSDDPMSLAWGIPDNWPEGVPLPVGLAMQSFGTNPVGGFHAIFMGEGDAGEVVQDFVEALADWTETESLDGPAPGESITQRSFYRDNKTLHIRAFNFDEGIRTSLTIFYNWFTLPGELPDGWPEDVVIMPELELRSGFTGDSSLGVVMTGDIDLREAVDFYINNMTGWEIWPETERIQHETETLIIKGFDRGSERITLNGYIIDETIVIRLFYSDHDLIEVQEE